MELMHVCYGNFMAWGVTINDICDNIEDYLFPSQPEGEWRFAYDER